MVRYRKLEADDAQWIVSACREYLDKIVARSNKQWVHHIDFNKVIEYIADAEDAYIVEEKFLVLYDIVTPWFTSSRWLAEKLVLSLATGGDFTNVTDFLEERARAEDAVLIGVGTSLAISDRALARCYSQRGFKGEVQSLFKEP